MPELTTQEIEAEVVQAAIEGRAPDFSDRLPTRPGAAPPAAAAAEEDIFTAADLCGDLLQQCTEYTVPRTGKKMYVFGIGSDDAELMLKWSLRRLDPEGESDDVTDAITRQAAYEVNLKIAQVIVSCRQGPTRKAKRCFSLADFHSVKKNLPVGARNTICALSDQLSGDDEALGAGVRRFFGLIANCLETCSSRFGSSADCPPGLKDTLARCGSLVSHSLLRGNLDSATLDELTVLEARLKALG